jgi:hypothetical protein
VNWILAVYDPVWVTGESASTKLRFMVLGSALPHVTPVQEPAGSVRTAVELEVLAVIAPEQGVPRVAPPHVYCRLPEATEGPPTAKSVVILAVMLPPTTVRAR